MVIANGRFFAGSMMVAPEARLDDGLFDIILIKDFTRLNVLRHISKIYRGAHLDLAQVMTTRGRSVAVSSREPAPLEMDGEQPGTLQASFQIVERGINFLLPSEPSHS